MSFGIRCIRLITLLAFCLAVTGVFGQSDNAAPPAQFGNQVSDSIVTVLVEANGQSRAVGSGVVVRGDGLLLTAYHIVRDARGVKIRLHNGETFDAPEVVAFDQRRNIALLRIAAAGLQALPMRGVEEGLVGSRVFVVSHNENESPAAGLLSSLSLVDEIAGAGSGYRVLKFTAPASANGAGSLLVDERGRGVGLLAAFPHAESQNYAVPFASVLGMTRAAAGNTQSVVPALSALVLTPAAASPTPIPIPQRDVLVPQRPVSPLAAKGPGSVVVNPSRPGDVLAASKTVFVTSRTVNFQAEHLINALGKKSEFGLLGLSFVDEREVADLVLTIDHVVFTYKFTFSLAHQRTGVVVATGSVIIWDGNLGAPRMADRVIEKLAQVRLQAAK
ncbi:MAG: serine protease Do [Blastocatellia bacterium]|jgi:S1-C subfamily serine protease|nr:serine protease Do [Blastocatellia bacterium]